MENEIFMNSTLIASIKKNNLVELRISLLKNNMIDARMYMSFPGESEPKPTKKGLWISPKQLPEIIEAFEGLLKDTKNELDLEFERSKATEKMKVYTADFKGKKLVHIRIFYSKENEFLPGKGVSFSISLLKDVLDALKQAQKQVPQI